VRTRRLPQAGSTRTVTRRAPAPAGGARPSARSRREPACPHLDQLHQVFSSPKRSSSARSSSESPSRLLRSSSSCTHAFAAADGRNAKTAPAPPPRANRRRSRRSSSPPRPSFSERYHGTRPGAHASREQRGGKREILLVGPRRERRRTLRRHRAACATARTSERVRSQGPVATPAHATHLRSASTWPRRTCSCVRGPEVHPPQFATAAEPP
jgi:hypothetical protein